LPRGVEDKIETKAEDVTGGATDGFGERSWMYLATWTRTWTRARAGGAQGGGAREDGDGSCVRAGEEEEGIAFIGQGPLVPGSGQTGQWPDPGLKVLGVRI
jgi:hypothetical protein